MSQDFAVTAFRIQPKWLTKVQYKKKIEDENRVRYEDTYGSFNIVFRVYLYKSIQCLGIRRRFFFLSIQQSVQGIRWMGL